MVSEFSIPPSEYWKMTPAEVFILLESKRPKEIGGLHEDQIEQLVARRAEAEQQGIKVI